MSLTALSLGLMLLASVARGAPLQSDDGASRDTILELERTLAQAPDLPALDEPPAEDGTLPPVVREVELPDGRTIPLLVLLPPGYDPARRWPVLLAMHGGPTDSPRSAFRGAVRMLEVWLQPAADAGWIVASPAMTHVVARSPRTPDALHYEILRVQQMEALLAELMSRFAVDPNRIVSTGISLGSNFSIAFAASRPDRFAAIVPVSTEGESRERLLRNLLHVPTFVLEGALDPNIRDIQGPRAMAEITKRFGYDVVYRELAERGHEGFGAHYPEVLRWLARRPRVVHPKQVLRVPHDGIVPIARRVHWVESDTRRGLVRARVVSRGRIEIDTRWTRSIQIFLTDHLVDLDEPIAIAVNGELVLDERVTRSAAFAREDVAKTGDPARVYGAAVRVDVPTTSTSVAHAKRFSMEMTPSRPAGTLSFWEMYAVGALDAWFPDLGITGTPIALEPDRDLAELHIEAISNKSPLYIAGVREGDTLIAVDGEPFFVDSSTSELRAWLMREATHVPRTIPLRVRRRDRELMLDASFSLEIP